MTLERARKISAFLSVLALAVPAFGGGPSLDSLAPDRATRSGRFLILGSGFGAEQGDGRALVEGRPAIVTRWLPTEIHAYVPEGASLGEVDVQVVTGEGESEIALLEVTAREPEGRIRWRFQTDRWMNRQFIEVGADERVYTSDESGLYALGPDGALLWFVPGAGGGHPIDIGPDGTIYTGVSQSEGPEIIRALGPDGSPRWEFVPPIPWNLISGPNVGPDGNIYASQDFVSEGGLGFFSLNPQGNLRWSNVGDPPLDAIELPDISSSEVVFASDRLYTGAVFLRSGGNAVSYAFDFAGGQIWFSGNSDLDALMHTFPRVDPQERAVGVWGQTGITTILPDGGIDWIRLHPHPNLLRMPAIDSLGNIYTGDLIGVDLWSLTPEGETRWVGGVDSGLNNLGVSPDAAVVVASGSTNGLTWVRGHDAADGSLLWQVDLPIEMGLTQDSTNLYPVFSRDARTAYLTTAFSNVGVIDSGNLFALAIGEPPLTLTQDPLRRGEDATLTVGGAVAGERVHYFASRAGTGRGPCLPPLGDLCLDLRAPLTHLGSAIADAGGIARLTVTVAELWPATRTLHTQAAVRRDIDGSDSVTSNTVSAPVLP